MTNQLNKVLNRMLKKKQFGNKLLVSNLIELKRVSNLYLNLIAILQLEVRS